MIKIENLKFAPGYVENDVLNLVSKTLKCKLADIESYVILKKSIDARKKPDVKIVLTLAVKLKNKNHIAGFEDITPNFSGLEYENISNKLPTKFLRPVVVGFGPAGMFCALSLAYMGLKPIVVEQGKCVEDRTKDVLTFWETGKINPFSNVQFGEGGAGTFSDGKLNTNLNNTYCKKVINEFVLMGAPKEIAYVNKPHIGSDNLKTVVKNIRQKIIQLGGTVLFNTQFVNYTAVSDNLRGVIVKNLQTNDTKIINTNHLVLAVGHSARQTFNTLFNNGLEIKQKPFAMGVRIEQSQSDINISQYGSNNKLLPNADYKLAVHLSGGRSVFTFCMCPGGVVVNSASDEGEIVTNGMSYFARDKQNANSAVLVNVLPSDFKTDHPLGGVYFQQKYEQLAFNLTKSFYCPAQSVGEFLTGKKTPLKIEPSLKVKICDIKKCLPNFVVESLMEALPMLNNKLKNFAHPQNLLIAIESRTSSPITIVRNEKLQTKIKGIFPCGEGAGYAGGIISSAVDGVKVAEQIYLENKN